MSAAVLRVLLPIVAPQAFSVWLVLAAMAWSAAFGIYAWIYTPWLLRARVDGNRAYNPGWHTALALANLLTVSEAITRSAIERRESRGAQFREDYPGKDEAFAQGNIVVRKGRDGRMQVRRQPLPPLPPELKQVLAEMK